MYKVHDCTVYVYTYVILKIFYSYTFSDFYDNSWHLWFMKQLFVSLQLKAKNAPSFSSQRLLPFRAGVRVRLEALLQWWPRWCRQNLTVCSWVCQLCNCLCLEDVTGCQLVRNTNNFLFFILSILKQASVLSISWVFIKYIFVTFTSESLLPFPSLSSCL